MRDLKSTLFRWETLIIFLGLAAIVLSGIETAGRSAGLHDFNSGINIGYDSRQFAG